MDQGVNKKQEIVRVALRLFSSRGYDSVSTTEIAQHVGVSQPNIHYYFKTKDLLWKAAIEHLGERIELVSHAVLSPRVLDDIDPLAALKVLSAALHAVSREIPELGMIIHLEGQAGGDRLEWLLERVILPAYAVHLDLIGKCIEQGLIKPYPPHQILLLLHGAAVSYYNLAPMVEAAFDADPNDVVESAAFTDLYLDAVFAGLQIDTT